MGVNNIDRIDRLGDDESVSLPHSYFLALAGSITASISLCHLPFFPALAIVLRSRALLRGDSGDTSRLREAPEHFHGPFPLQSERILSPWRAAAWSFPRGREESSARPLSACPAAA